MGPDPVRRACLSRLCAAALAPAVAGAGLAGCGNVPLSDIGPALSDDGALSQAVRDALAAAPETARERILVSTRSPGVVRLSGNVDQDITRTFAEQIAEGVPGVARVINSIFIRD